MSVHSRLPRQEACFVTDPRYIRWFADLSMSDVALVGGKTASLGERVGQLAPRWTPLMSGSSDLLAALASGRI